MEEMKWSSSVFLGVLVANKQHWFLAWLWLKSAKLFASDSAIGHDMSEISHTEPF
jgi:hypothetical protein